MNIYAFKRHLSLRTVSRLIICYWFPYRTSYIYFNFEALSLPVWFPYFFSPVLFLPLQALLSLCRCIGNMYFFFLLTVGMVPGYEGRVLITGLMSSPSQPSSFLWQIGSGTGWEWWSAPFCRRPNRKEGFEKKGHILTKIFENESQQSANYDFYYRSF